MDLTEGMDYIVTRRSARESGPNGRVLQINTEF